MHRQTVAAGMAFPTSAILATLLLPHQGHLDWPPRVPISVSNGFQETVPQLVQRLTPVRSCLAVPLSQFGHFAPFVMIPDTAVLLKTMSPRSDLLRTHFCERDVRLGNAEGLPQQVANILG